MPVLGQDGSIYPPATFGEANECYTVCLDKSVVDLNAVVGKRLEEVIPTSNHHLGSAETGTSGICEGVIFCHQGAQREKIATIDSGNEGESDLVRHFRHVDSWRSTTKIYG